MMIQLRAWWYTECSCSLVLLRVLTSLVAPVLVKMRCGLEGIESGEEGSRTVTFH
jgi:hypothetical protein